MRIIPAMTEKDFIAQARLPYYLVVDMSIDNTRVYHAVRSDLGRLCREVKLLVQAYKDTGIEIDSMPTGRGLGFTDWVKSAWYFRTTYGFPYRVYGFNDKPKVDSVCVFTDTFICPWDEYWIRTRKIRGFPRWKVVHRGDQSYVTCNDVCVGKRVKIL